MKVHTVYGCSDTYDAVLTCILLHNNGYTYHSNILITIQVTFHPIYHRQIRLDEQLYTHYRCTSSKLENVITIDVITEKGTL